MPCVFTMRCATFDQQDGALAVDSVATMITIAKSGSDFSQIFRADRLTAQQAESLRAWRPAVHKDVSHVAPPNAKQNTVSDELYSWGGGAQR